DQIDVGVLCTFVAGTEYPHAVPMSRQEVDENGHIWFLFSSESDTHQHLQRNDKVSLLFSDISNYIFLNINGKARISQDQGRIDKYWSNMVAAWFEKGREDPRVRALQVLAEEAQYWDTKSNKVMTLLKAAASGVSGKQMHIGTQGELDV